VHLTIEDPHLSFSGRKETKEVPEAGKAGSTVHRVQKVTPASSKADRRRSAGRLPTRATHKNHRIDEWRGKGCKQEREGQPARKPPSGIKTHTTNPPPRPEQDKRRGGGALNLGVGRNNQEKISGPVLSQGSSVDTKKKTRIEGGNPAPESAKKVKQVAESAA